MAKRRGSRSGDDTLDVSLNKVASKISAYAPSIRKSELYPMTPPEEMPEEMGDMMINTASPRTKTKMQDGTMIDSGEDAIYVDLEGDEGYEDDEGEDEGGESEEFENFDENLAEGLPEKVLDDIAAKLIEDIEADIESRKPWEEFYKKGIEALGLVDAAGDDGPFEGASTASYPMLLDGVIQFQARALAELFPPTGPVKTIVHGKTSRERKEQAQRVEDYMNYQLTVEDAGYFDELDQMLLYLGVSGSAFKKTYYDELLETIVGKFIRAEDIIVPYHAKSLETAPRVTHRMLISCDDMCKLQKRGFYRDIELVKPSDRQVSVITETDDKADNTVQSIADDDVEHTVFESSCSWALDNYVANGHEEKGVRKVKKPYIITVDRESRKVLAIRRNWRKDDTQLFEKRLYIVHYKYLPGVGFYGFGLYHLIGGLSRAATGALRTMLDSAGRAACSGGFRASDIKMPQAGDFKVGLGEWKDVNMTSEELSKAFFPIPSRDPSPAMFQLLGYLVEAGNRTSSATEEKIGQGGANTPVGTELARIEQGAKVYSSIHKRMHNAATKEFRIRAELTYEYIGAYEYEVDGDQKVILESDFDGRVDVFPVSDPNITSTALRIAQAQAIMQMAIAKPQMYNLYEVERRMLEAQNIPAIDEILINPNNIPRLDAVAEVQAIMMQKPVKAYPDQDHTAHITVITAFMEHPNFGGNPQIAQLIMPQLVALLAQHKAYEFAQIMQQAGAPVSPVDLGVANGQSILQDEMTVDQEYLHTQIAAQVIPQFLQMQGAPLPGDKQQPQQDPEAMKAEAEIQRKAQAAQAEEQMKQAEFEANQKRLEIAFQEEERRKDEVIQRELQRSQALEERAAQSEYEQSIKDDMASEREAEAKREQIILDAENERMVALLKAAAESRDSDSEEESGDQG